MSDEPETTKKGTKKKPQRVSYAKLYADATAGQRFALPILRGALATDLSIEIVRDRITQALTILGE